MIKNVELVLNEKDREKWGEHWIAERLKALDGEEWLTPDQKFSVRRNVAHLIGAVGEFNVASLVGYSGWSTLFPAVSWHIEALDAMARTRGGNGLLERVKRGLVPDASSILELAWRFVSVGAEVEIEPTVEVGDVSKRPDLALIGGSGQRLCLIEAASNTDSIDQSACDEFRKRIQLILFQNGFMNVFAGEFVRILTDGEVAKFETDLKAAVAALAAFPDPLLSLEGAFKLVVSHDPGDCAHARACEKYGVKPRTISYPPFDPREEIWTLRKIKKEMLHFPEDIPALIVIEAHPLMAMVEGKKQRLATLQETFRSWMDQQMNFLSVVVTIRFLAPQAASTFVAGGDLLIEQSLGLTGFDHLVIFNRAFDGPGKDELQSVIKEAFLKHYK